MAAALASLLIPNQTGHAQGTGFTYQGRLSNGNQPVNGVYDLEFTLFPSGSGGASLAGPVTNSAVAVTNGLFATAIDFGPGAFSGGSYWLEIQTRTNGSANWSLLTPRQQLTPVPLALYAAGAGTVPATNLTGTLAPSALPAVVVTNGAGGLTLSGVFTGNGTGLTGLNATSLTNGVSVTPARLIPSGLVPESSLPASGFPEAFGIAVAGNYVFLANLLSGFSVIDVSNPASPVIKASLTEASLGAGAASGVAVAGNLALLANEGDGLRIINVSTPASPAPVGNVLESSLGTQPSRSALAVAVTGNLACLANNTGGFCVIDISNPASPVVKAIVPESSLGGGSASGVAAAGNLAFLANASDGLRIFDLSNPTNPVVLGVVSEAQFAGIASGVAVAGNLACLANGSDGLRIIDVSNPANPVVLAGVPEASLGSGYASGAAVSGNLVYLANQSGGLSVIDISNPASPVVVTNLAESSLGNGSARAVAVGGKFAFTANDTDGLRITGYYSTLTSGAFAGDGSQLTALNAAALNGLVPASALPVGLLTNAQTGVTLGGTFSGNGAALTNLNPASLNGTVPDARLSSNVALRSGGNSFSGPQLVASGSSVGIGTNSPQADLHVFGVTAFNTAVVQAAGTGGTWLTLENNSTGGHRWNFIASGSANAEGPGKLLIRDNNANSVRMTIDTAGNVGIGNPNPGYTLDVSGLIRGSNVSPSDARYKTNVTTLTDALEKVLALRGVEYDWRREQFPAEHFTAGRQLGFIAQEVNQILPEAVHQDAQGYYSIAYDKIVPVLVEALKEQQAKMDRKAGDLEKLKQTNDALAERLQELEKTVRALASPKD